MTRKLAGLALVLVLSACAHQAAPPPAQRADAAGADSAAAAAG